MYLGHLKSTVENEPVEATNSQTDTRVVLVPGSKKEQYWTAPWADVIAAALVGADGLSVIVGVNPNNKRSNLDPLWAKPTVGGVMLYEAPWHPGMTALLHDRSRKGPAVCPADAPAPVTLFDRAEQS